MTPKGSLAYVAGLLALVFSCGLTGVLLLYAFVERRHPGMVEPVFSIVGLISLLVFLGAANLLAAGLYRMLCHVYRIISRTDPASDRPLRGRTVFLLGQIGTGMTIPMTVVFFALYAASARHHDDDVVFGIFLALAAGLVLTVTVTTFFVGLGLMVRDVFLRQQDLVDQRETERRRRLDESTDAGTEVIPSVLPVQLREHIREDR
jgi:hypothetical protein